MRNCAAAISASVALSLGLYSRVSRSRNAKVSSDSALGTGVTVGAGIAVAVGTSVGDGVGGTCVETGAWIVGTAVAVGIGDAVIVGVGDAVAVGEEPHATIANRVAVAASRNTMSRSFRCNVPVSYGRYVVSQVVTRRRRAGLGLGGVGA